MNVEQRLVAALRTTENVDPSPDLWLRVVHSIEEDQVHRRRIRGSAAGTAAVVALLVVVGLLSVADGIGGRQVRPLVMQLIETVSLVTLVAVLGPAIRRFGRGYADDLWPAAKTTGSALLRLLDVAYLLVFTGYILLSAELDLSTSGVLVAEQVQRAGHRIGGLLLVMGVLHAITLMALPLVALISNTTRVGRKLPKWLVIALIPLGAGIGLLAFMALLGAVGSAS